MRVLRLLAVLPVPLAIAGCPLDLTGDAGDDPQVCTMIFAAVMLDARDDAGQPVAVESVSVRRAGGEDLVCPAGRDDVRGCVNPFALSTPDRTRIAAVHDGVALARAGETLAVEAVAGTRRGAASLVVRNDGCHVEKVSGASEIVLR